MPWLERFAACFVDHREASRVEHAISVMVKQRILGIVAGYEDVNDHETLRDDALLALSCGQADLVGERRPRERDRGHALAGKSTLNRLEHAVVEERPSRYRRVALDPAAIEVQFVDCMIEAHDEVPERIVLDLDQPVNFLFEEEEHQLRVTLHEGLAPDAEPAAQKRRTGLIFFCVCICDGQRKKTSRPKSLICFQETRLALKVLPS